MEPAVEITRNVRLLRENKRQKTRPYKRDIRFRATDLYDLTLVNIRAGDSRSMDYMSNKEDNLKLRLLQYCYINHNCSDVR